MLAISNITRPGSPVRATIIAFGLGLSVLVMVSISESNIRRQIDTKISERAPDWFFIDIQSNQIGKFESIVQNTEGIKSFNKTPMLRGRVVKINGIPTSEITPPENSAWILRGDRAISWADEPPPGSNIVVGSWWPKDYNGEPLVSVSKDAADDFGLKINDTISINVLGKEIRAKIANLRKIDWQSFQINFVFVISSGVLEKAPHSWIATTHASEPKAVLAIENAVTSSFSNVSAISVKEAVATANQVIGLLGGALKLTAFVTLVSGVAVLAGTVASGETQRLSETVTLKVLGATRFSIGLAWLLEYMLLGLLTAIPAAIIGSIASWVLMEGFLQTKFYYDFWLVFSTTIFGAIGTAILGLVSAIRTLGKKQPLHSVSYENTRKIMEIY